MSFSLNLYGLAEPSKESPFSQRVARHLVELGRLCGPLKLARRKARVWGQVGDMVAIIVPSEDPRGGSYNYFWHAQGRPMDAYEPEIEAELLVEDTRGVDQETLDALWDILMGGFRLRGQAR